jgi:CBS domain-containing protein/sporulation protein YlmC with PRC-barrel domain
MPTSLADKNDAARMFIYFSQLMERPVIDKNGSFVGKVYDIVVKPTQVYPQSTALIVRKGFPNRTYAVVPWTEVQEIDENEARLKIEAVKLAFSEKHDERTDLTLRRDILDQQVVDTHNHKVIRVNDVHLLRVENTLMAAHVDITARGLLRRLGFEQLVLFFFALVYRNAPYLQEQHLISWKYIQPLTINPASMTIKVDIPQKNFSNIPAADLGEIFLDLNMKHQIALFKSLDNQTKAKIFINIDFKTQKSLLEELSHKEKIEVLNAIPADEATDFLEKLPSGEVETVLKLMESKYSKRLSQLLGYSSDSAGGLMTTEYIAFPKEIPIDMVLKQIREREFKTEPAQFVYIVDEQNRLMGATNFRRLISADPQEPLLKAAFPKIYSVHLDSSVKEVAYLMDKYKYYVIPVVDGNNILQGIITVDDILSQVISIAWKKIKRVKGAH